jgi:hypothetical protein
MIKWIASIRSICTFLIVTTFCLMASFGRIDGKDFMAVVMIVVTFYFALKDRTQNGGQEK